MATNEIKTDKVTTGSTNPLVVKSGDAIGANASPDTTLASGGSGSGTTGNVIIQTGATSGTRGKIKLKDGSEGTAGYVWTSTDTAGTGHWAAAGGGGGGATTALDNLSSVAINTGLIFGSSVAGELKTNDEFTSGTQTLTLASGNAGGSGSTGNVNISTGTTSDGSSTSGNVFVSTGSGASNNPTGNIIFETGNASGLSGQSGYILLQTGTLSGGATTRGTIQFADGSEGTPGDLWVSKDSAGSGNWQAPTFASQALDNLNVTAINVDLIWAPGTAGTLKTDNPTGDSSYLTIATGDAGGSGTNSGLMTIKTGTAQSAGQSGPIEVRSGDVVDGQSGQISLITGSGSGGGSDVTGSISIITGSTSLGSSGQSGAIQINSGTADQSNSGDLTFYSGISNGGASGSISLYTGDSSGIGTGTGGIYLNTGNGSVSGVTSGDFFLGTGYTVDKDSGKIQIGTGGGGSTTTGTISIYTGDTYPISSANSGGIQISTGNSVNAASGDITFSTGSAASSDQQGSVYMNVKRLYMSGGSLMQLPLNYGTPSTYTAQQGDMYFDTSATLAYIYDGSTWRSINWI
jgi:hypothetical protein